MNERIIQAISKLKKAQDELEIKLKSMEQNIDEKGSLNMQKALFAVADDLARYTIKDGNWYYNGKDMGIQAEAHDGKDGEQGPQGIPGKEGKPGRDGRPGKDGKPGKDGRPGRDGKDGKPGKDGRPGRDGKDGITPELKIGKIEVSPEYGGAMAKLRPGKDNIIYLDLTLPRGPQGFTGFDGKDAKINGENTIEIKAGRNITINQDKKTLTINSTGGGGGGSSDYEDLENLPRVNNVELKGNKSLNDLGIQPVGNYALESEMIEAQNDLDHLSKVSNLFEKITGTGTSVTLNDTSDTIMKLNLDTITSSQNTTTGRNLYDYTDLLSQYSFLTYDGDGWYTAVCDRTNYDTERYFNFSTKASNLLETDTTYTIVTEIKSFTTTGNGGVIHTVDRYGQFVASTGAINTVGTHVQTATTKSNFTGITDMLIGNIWVRPNSKVTAVFRISVIKGTDVTVDNFVYEPYTGGQPAPSPSYPQAIHTISGDNAITISNSDNTKSQEYPINLGDIELCKIGDYEDSIRQSTGKNLFDRSITPELYSYNSSGVKVSDTDLCINQELNNIDFSSIYVSFSSIVGSAYVRICEYNSSGTFIKRTLVNTNQSLTLDSNTKKIIFSVNASSAKYFTNLMINEGTTALPYEPYGKVWYKYGAIGKVVLDGSEDYDRYSSLDTANYNCFYLTRNNFFVDSTGTINTTISNYFLGQSFNDRSNNIANMWVNKFASQLYFKVPNTITTSSELKTWLNTHNTTVYYVLATPTYTLLNDTLQTQLDSIQYALAYDTQTNISQTNNDLPFIINAETYKEINLADYVKNTDYASTNKGGVVKADEIELGIGIASNGKLLTRSESFENYQRKTVYFAISKGTLENVITGKELDLKQLSTFDSTKTQVLKNINGTLTWVDE